MKFQKKQKQDRRINAPFISWKVLLILYLIFQTAQEVIDYVVMFVKDPEHAFFDFQLFFPMWTLWYLLAMILYNILLPVLIQVIAENRSEM